VRFDHRGERSSGLEILMLFILCAETFPSDIDPTALLPWEIREPIDPDEDFATVDAELVWVDGATETGEALEDSAAAATAYGFGRSGESPDGASTWAWAPMARW